MTVGRERAGLFA
jgi:hypothetical protein